MKYNRNACTANAIPHFFSFSISEQERFYTQVFQHSAIPQIILDREFAIVAVNGGMFGCLHMKPQEVTGKRFGDAFSCRSRGLDTGECGKCRDTMTCPIRKAVRDALGKCDSAACTETPFTWYSNKVFRTKWFQISAVRIRYHDTDYALLSFVDITIAKHRENFLRKRMSIDKPTGLMNKQSLIKEIEKLVRCRGAKGSTLCMVDFDNFKGINDRFGHLFGDKVLKTFADIARRQIRAGDQVGRFGGEEFIFLFRDSDMQQSIGILQRICRELDKCFQGEVPVPITLSAGLVSVDTVGEVPAFEDLIRDADQLLYRAKRRGKSRVVSKSGEYLFRTGEG